MFWSKKRVGDFGLNVQAAKCIASWMNTPAHLIIGAAAFARPGDKAVNSAALAGAVIPDLSLYIMAANELFILKTDPGIVFGQMYFSEEWQRIFAIDNSVFLWATVLIAGLALQTKRDAELGGAARTPRSWMKSFPVSANWVAVLGAAALLHIALDFPLHHDDGRAHFWPLSDWIFESPLSYWDSAHFGQIVGPLEGVLCLCLCAVLWLRFRGWLARSMIAAAGVIELSMTLLPLVFGFISQSFGF